MSSSPHPPEFVRWNAAAVAALLAALVWLYWNVVAGLVRQWSSDGDYSHGFFVAPLAAFFAWERRDALRRAARRPTSLGILVLAGSLLCYLAGLFGSELFLTRVSLIGVVAGLVLFIAGIDHARILAFPILFLLLMVPLNLAVSWWLIGVIGAGGAVIGSAVGVAVCQVVPNLLYVRRDLSRRRADAALLAAAPGPPTADVP